MKIIDKQLLAEFRAKTRCEWCERPTPNGCDPHHAYSTRGAGRLDIRINLIALCWECHRVNLDRMDGREVCRWIVARRERRTMLSIWQEIWQLRETRKWMVVKRDE